MNIPVVILCGGKGARLGPVGRELPKPLLEIGGKPILWHVMKIYAQQGCRRFILCLGHKSEQVRSYIKTEKLNNWQVSCVNTGLESLKSERLKQIKPMIRQENFFLAYGDDVADINLSKLLAFHLKTRAIVTITTVKMFSIFGVVEAGQDGRVKAFQEKPLLDKWMSGGFMAANRKIFDYLSAGELESEVFKKLVSQGKLCAYKHYGQWKTMNTLKDNIELNEIWKKRRAFWKKW